MEDNLAIPFNLLPPGGRIVLQFGRRKAIILPLKLAASAATTLRSGSQVIPELRHSALRPHGRTHEDDNVRDIDNLAAPGRHRAGLREDQPHA